HEFEDFLDWLHDESPVLDPNTVAAMQEGTDLLIQITEHPTQSFADKKEALEEKFNKILASATAESEPAATQPVEEPLPSRSEKASSSPSGNVASKATDSPDPVQHQGGRKKVATLRVDVEKVDQVVGLSGDMAINLSSFESSMSAMTGTLNELGMILQRLKNINYSLEAGYELASIPHLGSIADSSSGDIAEDFDPLEMDRYSELNILIRSLSEAVGDLDSIMDQSSLENIAWQKTVERQTRVLKEIQNKMIGIRMTPLATLSGRMQRTVREAARTTGHPARLVIKGESIMMDTRIWDIMADPFMHILRNAVSHGGGSKQLTIQLNAERKGGQFTLRIIDDGKGLDYAAIRNKGMKLYPHEKIEEMSKEQLAELIFRHGFSSAGSITSIAGRGVGMDVVRDAVEQLTGSIQFPQSKAAELISS
ncbi:MAG: hypothetical protein D3923_14105, partial [Candidatus Electrothrix sp. AR3]|nr:hypothetical protein [Candidatus Electrothrix sp. AR3]